MMSGASPATSLPPSIPAGAAKRTSARQDCSRVHPNVSHDPHTVCITCRGLCSDAIRCEECAGWDALTVGRTSSYQAKLERCCSRYARSRWHGSVSAPRTPPSGRAGAGDITTGTERVNSLSSMDSFPPQDSASQVGPTHSLECQLASLLTHGSHF